MTTAPTQCSDDGQLLLASIMANPDEDTPRLAYADWLDENGGTETVPCPKCKGTRYHRNEKKRKGGSDVRCECRIGTVTRPCSRAARAELIRVSCELHRLEHDQPCTLAFYVEEAKTSLLKGMSRLERGGRHDEIDGKAHTLGAVRLEAHMAKMDRLRAREQAILAAWEGEWRKGPKCGKCDSGSVECHICKAKAGKQHKGYCSAAGDRDCPDCHGTSDVGGLLRKFDYHVSMGTPDTEPEPVRVTYSRGTKLVTVPSLSDCVERAACPVCGTFVDLRRCTCCRDLDATHQPTGWLAAVVRHHPDCEAVCVLDREPFYLERGAYVWVCDSTDDRDDIPSPLFAHMPESEYPTADAANLALGRAVAKFGRQHTA